MSSAFLVPFRYYHLGEAAHFDLPLYLHMFPLAYDSYPICTTELHSQLD